MFCPSPGEGPLSCEAERGTGSEEWGAVTAARKWDALLSLSEELTVTTPGHPGWYLHRVPVTTVTVLWYFSGPEYFWGNIGQRPPGECIERSGSRNAEMDGDRGPRPGRGRGQPCRGRGPGAGHLHHQPRQPALLGDGGRGGGRGHGCGGVPHPGVLTQLGIQLSRPQHPEPRPEQAGRQVSAAALFVNWTRNDSDDHCLWEVSRYHLIFRHWLPWGGESKEPDISPLLEYICRRSSTMISPFLCTFNTWVPFYVLILLGRDDC